MSLVSGFGCPVLNGEQVFIPATDKQLRYIEKIQECLDVEPFSGTTKESAAIWLERYAPMYEDYMLQMQAEFIDHEENYGDRI